MFLRLLLLQRQTGAAACSASEGEAVVLDAAIVTVAAAADGALFLFIGASWHSCKEPYYYSYFYYYQYDDGNPFRKLSLITHYVMDRIKKNESAVTQT